MDTITVSADAFVCDLAADTPSAIEVLPGSTLRVHCRHALDMRVGPGPVRAGEANPGTGPIAVRHARPGQALRIEILDIDCASPGHVAGGRHGELQAAEIRAGRVLFHGAALPLAPMIGTIGVTPASGSWNTKDAGPFGGNMVLKYLPLRSYRCTSIHWSSAPPSTTRLPLPSVAMPWTPRGRGPWPITRSSSAFEPSPTLTLYWPAGTFLPQSSVRSQRTVWAKEFFFSGGGGLSPSRPATRCRTASPLASSIHTATSV